MDNVAELMRRFDGAGGRMVAGTDTSTIGLPGARLHRELQLWVARGIPPMSALKAATLHPAQLFRRSDLGVIAVGRAADLVLLEASPLADIRNLSRIAAVVKDGRPVQRGESP
jgi:imidazolonepropionase-like amidohydrolase